MPFRHHAPHHVLPPRNLRRCDNSARPAPTPIALARNNEEGELKSSRDPGELVHFRKKCSCEYRTTDRQLHYNDSPASKLDSSTIHSKSQDRQKTAILGRRPCPGADLRGDDEERGFGAVARELVQDLRRGVRGAVVDRQRLASREPLKAGPTDCQTVLRHSSDVELEVQHVRWHRTL